MNLQSLSRLTRVLCWSVLVVFVQTFVSAVDPTWAQPFATPKSTPLREVATNAQRHASAPPFTKGLLWQIIPPSDTTEQIAPSFVFGTMHSEDPRVLRIATQVQPSLAQSESFCMEMLTTPAAINTMTTSMVYTNGQSLSATIGASLFQQVRLLMLARGIPEVALEMFKPWAVLMMLSMPQQKSEKVLDATLFEKAQQHGKDVCGLETVEEQIQVFEQMPLADQLTFLRSITKNPNALKQQHEHLISRYLARDLAGLSALSQDIASDSRQEQQAIERFYARLIDERNVRMVRQMVPRLQHGAVFVAVGALHLPGKNGILQMLSDKGYSVVPLQ